MTDLSTVKIKNAIVKIIGIFEGEKKSIKQLENSFVEKQNYNKPSLSKLEKTHHRNYWYPEFRKLWFEEGESVVYLVKKINKNLEFVHNQKIVEVYIKYFEIYLMPNGLHFFSVACDTEDKTAEGYSDLCNLIRNFYSKISGEKNWVDWIEKNCLDNIQISADEHHLNVKVDEFSGSKFKLYQVFELEDELMHSERLRLLFDLATVSKIRKDTEFSTQGISERYMNEQLINRLSIFNNYDMLPLMDSFTILGHGFLSDEDSYSFKTYNESYFRIYLHTLLLKFNLYRYQSQFHLDNLSLRDTFENFLNSYNLSHISYNFLPNTIFRQIKNTIEIEEELSNFKARIVSLNETIRQEQQRRTNALLQFIGIIASIGSVGPFVGFLEKLRINLACNSIIFYSAIFVPLSVICFFVLKYLFPQQLRNLKRKIYNK